MKVSVSLLVGILGSVKQCSEGGDHAFHVTARPTDGRGPYATTA